MGKLRIFTVNDLMQRGYRYVLTEPVGRNYNLEFLPELALPIWLAPGALGV